ncbi:stage III sporulation protein AF [Bacillaceae bacterium S4-13-56]
MDFIIEWVTQIIIFLLIAMVVDLLLPSSSFKTYTKLVMGLLLILIFLNPVFELFKLDSEAIVQRGLQSFQGEVKEVSLENSIELKKKEIQAQQDAYILDQMAVQLKEKVEEEMMDEYDMTIKSISFEFEEDRVDYEAISNINVYVVSSSNSEQNTIEEVELVRVTLNHSENQQEEPPEQEEKIRSLLAKAWEIDEEMISLQCGEGCE